MLTLPWLWGIKITLVDNQNHIQNVSLLDNYPNKIQNVSILREIPLYFIETHFIETVKHNNVTIYTSIKKYMHIYSKNSRLNYHSLKNRFTWSYSNTYTFKAEVGLIWLNICPANNVWSTSTFVKDVVYWKSIKNSPNNLGEILLRWQILPTNNRCCFRTLLIGTDCSSKNLLLFLEPQVKVRDKIMAE